MLIQMDLFLFHRQRMLSDQQIFMTHSQLPLLAQGLDVLQQRSSLRWLIASNIVCSHKCTMRADFDGGTTLSISYTNYFTFLYPFSQDSLTPVASCPPPLRFDEAAWCSHCQSIARLVSYSLLSDLSPASICPTSPVSLPCSDLWNYFHLLAAPLLIPVNRSSHWLAHILITHLPPTHCLVLARFEIVSSTVVVQYLCFIILLRNNSCMNDCHSWVFRLVELLALSTNKHGQLCSIANDSWDHLHSLSC